MKQIYSTHFAALLLFSFFGNLIEGNEVNHGDRLIQWLREGGGHVSDKIEIRRDNPNDVTSRFGVFATSDMKRRDLLVIVPTDYLITAVNKDEDEDDDVDEDEKDEEDEDEDSAMNCQLVRNLITEMKLGDDSKYAPYVNYLLEQPWGQLPSAWSHQGRALIKNMLEEYTIDPVPPIEPEDWLDDWHDVCEGSRDPFEENASLMVVQRSWDDILIPVYDMMSHRNGHWLNTESNSVHGDADVVVRASRNIKAGEELYTSYNLCEDCGNRVETYGTPEILRDYGFIENYPQRWIFPESIGFEIDEKKEGSGLLSLTWLSRQPTVQDVDTLKDVKEGMNIFGDTKLKMPSEFIPSTEIATIRQFHKALSRVTDLALEIAYTDDEACSTETEDQLCVIPKIRYDNLSEKREIEYNEKVCDIDEIMEFNDYRTVEEIKTPYQHITVIHNDEDNDTCFDLDETVQICANYRPHYHEMSVHYAARYLKSIKRVLFVGGGDSMLLHEVLLYPSIETVVGLELDQKVTRMSFKYFGTQPHWDNDKVEWWFGDATKSLLMLPKEYFGSFDMVLVDLSETVMSFKVTDKLDIVEVLALLLTPDGIMLKNELYFEDMSNIFRHTVQYFYDGVPTICSQAMVLGSNSINFLREENLTDHSIDTLLIGPLDYEKHFALFHDYAWKPDNINKHCMTVNDILSEVPMTQLNSPGIIMIVEAEDASLSEQSSKEISELIANTVHSEGFTMISKTELVVNTVHSEGFTKNIPGSENKDNMSVVVMNEGYVVCHYWPGVQYYGFDIHLWSRFGKQQDLKKALLLAVGSSDQSSSSFRIVAGGMFGTNTWRVDEGKRGPHRTHTCDQPIAKIPDTKTGINVIETILEESMRFIEQDSTVLVVCGPDNLQPCKAKETLEKNDKVGRIIDVWSCPNINKIKSNDASEMYSCERDLTGILRKRLVEDKIDLIVFDKTVTYFMGQILVRIFKNLKSRIEFLNKSPTVIALSDSKTKAWRSGLVNRFRTDVIIYQPVFMADILVEGTDTKIGVHIVGTNTRFTSRLRETLTIIEEQTGAHVVVEEILGGTPVYNRNFYPDREYTPDDYDQTSPLVQMASQRPLEYQTIFQLEVLAINAKKQSENTKLSKKKVRNAVEQTLSSLHPAHFQSDVAQIEEFSGFGDGYLFIALWPEGRVVLLWNGRDHIDINLTSRTENSEYFERFEKKFVEQLPFMKTMLRDEQPRGYGRVINFPKDIMPISELLWS